MKTIKLKVPDEITLIDTIHREIEKSEHKWDDNGNILEGTLNGGKIKSTCPETQDSGEVKIEMDAKAEKQFKILKLFATQKITTEEISKTIFANIPEHEIKSGNAMKLGDNLMILKEIDKFLKPLASKCIMYSYPNRITSQSAFEELTLAFAPYKHGDMKNGDLSSSFYNTYNTLEGWSEPLKQTSKLKEVTGEKVKTIKIEEYEIGNYYEERNLILIYINPLARVNLNRTLKMKENKYLFKIMSDIKNAIIAIKPKFNKAEDFKMRMMVTAFNASTKQKVDELKNQIERYTRDITSYENSITNFYKTRFEYKEQLAALDVVEDNQVENFINQINKVRKLKLVTGVTTDNGTVNITFIPTTIKGKLDRNINGKADGMLVECFIGSITAHIHGDGSIDVTCSHPSLEGKPHPHGNSDNRPCLGQGDGPRLMNRLIGEKKFADFVYVFWMWIKRWRNEDCYIHTGVYTDDRLKQGLPVWNQAGERIEINDPALIADGSLIKLRKHSTYEENYKKYKDFKLVR